MKSLARSNRNKLIILVTIAVLVVCLFLFYKVTGKNIGYFVPKRLIKITTFLLVSIATTYAAISFQTITNNNILTPSVMGLDNLYLLIQTIIVFFFGSRSLTMMTGTANFFLSIVIMVACSLLLFTMLFRKSRGIYFLLLTGMVFGTLFSGFASFMQVLLDPNEFTILQGKMFASFSSINDGLLTYSIFIVIFVMLFAVLDFHQLDVMLLGKENSINLGINYKKLVFKLLVIIAILTSVTTALVGPVSFLGIIITSLSRQLFKTYKHSVRVIGGILISMIFLTTAVFIVEHLFNFNTTISVIINLVGGIYFIILLLKEAKL